MLAAEHRATLHFVNVIGPRPLVGPLGAPYADTESENNDALRALRTLGQTPAAISTRHEYSVHRGSVSEILCRIVSARDVDLVVMSTHGRHGVRHFVIGSVAEEVFRNAECPVLTIGPGANPEKSQGRFGTILTALDLSPGSEKVLEYARTFSETSKARLVLFHAVPEPPEAADQSRYLDDMVATDRAQMLELKARASCTPELSIKIGPPAEMILQAAEDRGADLIVVGAHRGMRLAAHNPWAVAHEIVCAAPCPVLTVGH
jgi:nucleotide-binding universal stress UspA family protein